MLHALSEVLMSGHVKYKRNSLACKMQEDSACNTQLPLSLILATASQISHLRYFVMTMKPHACVNTHYFGDFLMRVVESNRNIS